jgi:hypothetical protein
MESNMTNRIQRGGMPSARSGRHSSRAFLVLAAIASQALAQAPGASPLAGGSDLNLPSGDRLSNTYRPGQGQLQVQALRGSGADATFGFLAAAAGQVQMPPGITLGRASTSRVMARTATAGTASLTAEERSPVDAQEKLVSLFPLDYNGVPLSKGSDYLMVVNAADGRVLHTRERSLPVAVDATVPTLTAAAAVAAARAAAGADFMTSDASPPRLEVWVDAQRNGRLAWAVTLDTRNLVRPQARTYWVSATGEPRTLQWESNIFHTHFGTASATIWATSPLQPVVNRPLAGMAVNRSDGTSVRTGADGRYGFPAGVGSTSLTSILSGPSFVTANQAGANITRTQTATPLTSADLNFGATGDQELAQTSAFYWANEARRVAGILLPTELAAMPVQVNIASSCNAFWNGISINFYVAGGACPNTAYSDVVLHEYGHAIDAVKGGIVDGGYSEGFGDALAILATRQPCLGRDFFGTGSCLRPATALIMWPPAGGEGVHAIGRRYAGFTWELVQQLRRTYADDEAFSLATRLVMAAGAANPSSIPDAVLLSFIADDTDGNLATCSPHFKELAAAADSRGIPRPANCVAVGGSSGVGAADAQFPWSPAMTVSVNSNIATASITLAQASVVHLVATSAARAVATGAVEFRNGFLNTAGVNSMWTNSLRSTTAPAGRGWSSFSSTYSLTLPAGTHQIFWKLWTTAAVELSGGTLLVESFPLASAAATAAPAEAGAAPSVSTVNARGRVSLVP